MNEAAHGPGVDATSPQRMNESDLRRWCRELWFYWEPEMWRDEHGVFAGCRPMRLRPAPLPAMRRDRRQCRTTVRQILDWLGRLQNGTTLPGTVAHVYLCRSQLRQALDSLDREEDALRMWPTDHDRILVLEEVTGAWRLELSGIPREEHPDGYRPPVWPEPYRTFQRWKRPRCTEG